MVSLLYDPAVFQHQNLIRISDSFQAMGDHDNGFASCQFPYGVLQMMLIFRIDIGGGLVKDNNGGILEHGPGNGNPLLLAAGEDGAAFTDNGVIAIGSSMMKSWQQAFLAACCTSSRVASGLPNFILLAMVS